MKNRRERVELSPTRRIRRLLRGFYVGLGVLFATFSPFDSAGLRRMSSLGAQYDLNGLVPVTDPRLVSFALSTALFVPVGLLIAAGGRDAGRRLTRRILTTAASVAASIAGAGLIGTVLGFESLVWAAGSSGILIGHLIGLVAGESIQVHAERRWWRAATVAASRSGTSESPIRLDRIRLKEAIEARSRATFWRAAERRTRTTLVIAALCTAALVCAGLPFFVFVDAPIPSQPDAVVALGPATTERVDEAVELLRRTEASTLVISSSLRDDGQYANRLCREPQEFEVMCFEAVPFTTAGEVHEVDELSAVNDWSVVVFATARPHVSRVRYVVDRCFDEEGAVVPVDSPNTPSGWAIAYLYQTVAFIKAATKTGC